MKKNFLNSILQNTARPEGFWGHLSEESVAFACKHNRQWLDKRCFIRQGDARHLPYSHGMFDAVTAFETIYFRQDLTSAFGKVSRVLRRGGIF